MALKTKATQPQPVFDEQGDYYRTGLLLALRRGTVRPSREMGAEYNWVYLLD